MCQPDVQRLSSNPGHLNRKEKGCMDLTGNMAEAPALGYAEGNMNTYFDVAKHVQVQGRGCNAMSTLSATTSEL